ncbi:hypothetical protein Ddc_16458 [Ditylenchus destructor]|nr:hypothetical protein Ddc_16458 [Ditylenchus destructor]
MRRLTEKQAKFENEAQMDPSAKKNRLYKRMTNIAALDNGTIVEAFKYLNYCRLARTSLVSKRFSNLIRTHRHKLALLYVCRIGMNDCNQDPTDIKIFKKTLSPEEYNNWVIHNGYSKQIPPETQIAGKQITGYGRKVYQLHAVVDYYYKGKDIFRILDTVNTDLSATFLEWPEMYGNPFKIPGVIDPISLFRRAFEVFDANKELSHENWPVFQHFFRLLTDPFIFICSMGLPRQNYSLNLLAGAINPNCGRIQCQLISVDLEDNMHNFINWIKGHVHCDCFSIMGVCQHEII